MTDEGDLYGFVTIEKVDNGYIVTYQTKYTGFSTPVERKHVFTNWKDTSDHLKDLCE